MSRRKQLKPQPVKEEVEDLIVDENEPLKKKRCTTSVHIKEDISSPSPSVTPTTTQQFNCQLCSNVFDSISALQMHTIKNHVPMPGEEPPASKDGCLECQHCSATFSNLPSFAIHMRTHLKDRVNGQPFLSCSFCAFTFSDPLSRKSHMISHFESLLAQKVCSDCGATFNTSSTLLQHYQDRHLNIQHVCLICAQTFDTIKDFREHSISHSQETLSFECIACRIVFESRELLGVHVQMMHDRDEVAPNMLVGVERPGEKEVRILQCSVCDEQCLGEDALDEHRLFSHCKVPHSDVCADCLEPLKTAEEFEKHTRQHAKNMYMYCAVCRQSLRSEQQLQLHCRFHMTPSTTQLVKKEEQQCEICSKVLVSRDQLLLHVLEHESSKNCPHCSESFVLAHQLLAHVSEQHAAESPIHCCQLCGESFQFQIQLDHHRLSHNETDPDSPEGSLISMVRNDRTSNGPTNGSSKNNVKRCPICCLSFNTTSRFESHLRKHANTSCCICQICSQGFTKRDDLEKHMRIHKGNLEQGGISI